MHSELLPIVYQDEIDRNLILSDGSSLPAIVYDIWKIRADLQQAFPDPYLVTTKKKGRDFKSWVLQHGFNEYIGLGYFNLFYVHKLECQIKVMRQDQPLSVAIILPTKNRPEFLTKSLESIASQSYSNWKLYLVDGSNDTHSETIAKKMLGENKVVYLRDGSWDELILEEKIAAARNLGMSQAKEDVFAHFDDDNVWTQHHLRKLIDPLIENESLAMSFALHRCIDPQTRQPVTDPNRFAGNAFQKYSIDTLLEANFIACDDVALRSWIFEELGGFRQDLIFYADWEYWCRVALKYPVQQVYELLTDYSVHKDSITSRLEDSRFISRHRSYVRKLIQENADPIQLQIYS